MTGPVAAVQLLRCGAMRLAAATAVAAVAAAAAAAATAAAADGAAAVVCAAAVEPGALPPLLQRLPAVPAYAATTPAPPYLHQSHAVAAAAAAAAAAGVWEPAGAVCQRPTLSCLTQRRAPCLQQPPHPQERCRRALGTPQMAAFLPAGQTHACAEERPAAAGPARGGVASERVVSSAPHAMGAAWKLARACRPLRLASVLHSCEDEGRDWLQLLPKCGALSLHTSRVERSGLGR
eukprot:365668-Chlamydomonas_euryale.AAC.7